MPDSRWVVPNEGDRVSVTHRSRRGSVADRDGVVERVDRSGDNVSVELGPPSSDTTVTFDPSSPNEYGTVTSASGFEAEALQLRVVVPASQVRYPGVSAGDAVKVGSGSNAYRVEEVTKGYVTLEDGRSVPVTQITAFDEDVDDYDAFQILPGFWDEVMGGE